jgi:hypothetical protein
MTEQKIITILGLAVSRFINSLLSEYLEDINEAIITDQYTAGR